MENVFLIASESKKEEWKRFLDEKTKQRIKWVEDTANRYGGYCVIAMKAYIEKREETFREIEEKYSEQLQRAKKVFIFHLKTGTSYVDHLEKIKGKGNWYYSVIDLDTGDPAKSSHNKGVIKDFKHKLLQEIEISNDEGSEGHPSVRKLKQGSEEGHPLVRKLKEVFVMVGEEKEQTIEYLLEKIKAECTGIDSKSKTKLKIIVFGNIGSGKSRLISSFMSALSGEIWNAAGEGGRDDLLYSSCGVYFKHRPDLVCYEIRGIHTGKREENDILKRIMEEKNDSGQTRDEDTIHVILYLVKDDKWLAYLPILNDKTENYKCLKYLVITHIDEECPNLKNNIKAIMNNDEVSKFKDRIQTMANVPKEFILPVVNSVDTTQTMTDPYRIYFLYLLLKFVMDAKEVGKQKQKKTKKKCIIL